MSLKHIELIHEYGKMKRLEGYNEQSRGQKFNLLIADLLSSWGISARSNLRSNGEIDVAFSYKEKQFILEAKWEKNPIDTGKLSKLQKRVRQRLRGTIGIFLSMSGYSQEAMKELTAGEQSSIICFSKDHFEAMLSGFIPPDEMISLGLEKASHEGEFFLNLDFLFGKPINDDLDLSFGCPPEITELVLESNCGYDFNSILYKIPFGSLGIAEESSTILLLSISQGIFRVDLEDHSITSFLNFPGYYQNPIISQDGSVYIARKSGVAKIKDKNISFIGGGLSGNISLSADITEEIWAYGNGLPYDVEHDNKPYLIKLGDQLGNQSGRIAGWGNSAQIISYDSLLICRPNGVFIIQEDSEFKIVSDSDIELTNAKGPIRISDETFLVVCNSVEIWEINIKTLKAQYLARLDLMGSAYLLAQSKEGGGYLACSYPAKENETKGIIVRIENK
jgi:Holliday junction resolvase-like predicted endonuclease